MKKIAFVVPRFEPQLAGGAEVHCARIAKKAVSWGYKVEVLTTCAKDHFSWKNFYESGLIKKGDIQIRRFAVDPNRMSALFLNLQRKIDHRFPLKHNEQIKWIDGSVRSREMEEYLIKNKDLYDAYIFIPYLFGTTYWGIKAVPEKSFIIPCLHDEPFAYLDIFKDMFHNVKGIMFNTVPEMNLAKSLYDLNHSNMSVVGLGFQSNGQANKKLFKKKYGINYPFILYAGRREGGKNTDLLIKYFSIFKNNVKSNLKLILLGSGEVNIDPHHSTDIIDLGYVSEEEKRSAFSNAFLFCQPSVNESLSIVLMESWSEKRPVLVNSRCNVTKYHCRESGGGLYFKDYPEFEECINFFIQNSSLADKMGICGNKYVENNFSWDVIKDRFSKSLNNIWILPNKT